MTRLAVIGLLAFYLSGCAKQNLYERLDEAQSEIVADQISYATEDDSQEIPLSWQEALKIFFKRNPELRQARTRLRDITRERRQFLLYELNPRFNAIASLSSALGNIASIDSDGVGVRLLGSVQIPDPFSLYARRYGLELEYYQTKLDYEALVRRSHANLYETFLTQDEVDRELQKAARPELPIEALSPTREDLSQFLIKSQRDETQTRRRQITLQRRITRLLNSPKKKYRLLPETLPRFDYEERYEDISFRNGFGLLALKQTAGEIESARAQLWQVKINRYPSVNVNVSLPSIYDSQSKDDPEFDDIRLFSGANDSLEFTGSEARSIRSAEERAQHIRDRIQIELSLEAESLEQLKYQYRGYLERERLLEEQLEWYRKNPPGESASLILEHLQKTESLRDELAQTRSYRRTQELEFWIWDEKYWDSPF